MDKIKEDISTSIKPTLSKPVGALGKGYEANFSKTMQQNHVNLNETDGLLTEREQSLKKKIFSLAKMEALVFSDPKLSTVYDEMSENGEEKYGYHYNETIMNMLFNDYVLNSQKYLQKYKMAIPAKKGRRDKSGINKLKKAGDINMHKKPVNPIQTTPATTNIGEDTDNDVTKVLFLVNETEPNSDVFAYFPEEQYNDKYMSGYSHVGQHTGVHPDYAAESREATPEEYQDLMAELESIGYNLQVLNNTNETTGAASSGAFAGPAAWQKGGDLMETEKVEETTSSSSSGAYAGPAAWGGGDLMKGGTSKAMRKPIWQGGTIIGESNYLTDPSGFAKYVDMLNEEVEINPSAAQKNPVAAAQANANPAQQPNTPAYTNPAVNNKIINDTSAFSSNTVKQWNKPDTDLELHTVNKGTMDEPQDIEEKATSPAQQRLFGMAHAVQKGELSPSKVGGAVKKIAATVSPKDVTDFASTKYDEMDETAQSIIDDKPDSVAKGTPTGTVSTGNVPVGLVDMKEEMDLLNEIDNELNAYSIHQKKLQQMSEDRKPSSLVLKDRLGAENATNFKKDFADSDTKDIINIEKELQWKDQQTDVPADPMKLGEDIENAEIKSTDAKGKEFLKNVGNSANDKGDEIPKRNMTTEEQDEVNIYRKGMHSLNYDNKPDKRFEDRMKADMGDAVYEIREKQMAEFGKAPMYNKEAQPTEPTKAVRTEFDKEKSGWNDLQGLKEAMISGRYRNALNKSHIIDFAINEVKLLRQTSEKTMAALFPLDFTGLGNSFNAKTVDNKVIVNEGVIGVLDAHKFYTDGKQVFAIKNPKQNLSEAKKEPKPPRINEEMEKMKHLLGYKPDTFVSTDKTKKNRGF